MTLLYHLQSSASGHKRHNFLDGFLSKYHITSSLNITMDAEVASICNPFFQYISCGEAYLLLNSHTSRLDKEQVLHETMNSDISDGMQRYVGSYCKQDVEILWKEQLKEDKLGKSKRC